MEFVELIVAFVIGGSFSLYLLSMGIYAIKTKHIRVRGGNLEGRSARDLGIMVMILGIGFLLLIIIGLSQKLPIIFSFFR